MISPLPDLASLYSPGSSCGCASSDAFSPYGGEDPLGNQPEKADRADLSALAREFAKQGGAFALFEFEYQSVRSVSQVRNGDSVSRQEYWQQSFEMHLTVGGDPEAAKALFAKLQDEFSPEKVSDRIASFALKGAEGKGDAFRDFIRAAIEQGYGEARRLLGPLDEKVSDSLEQTMKLLWDKLQLKQDQQDKPLEDSSIAA